jgi:hypothetical protein
VPIGSHHDWKAVSAGGFHTLALKQNGTLWGWGLNANGQLGDGTSLDRHAPIQIGSVSNWIAVEAGTYYSVALRSDGSVWQWPVADPSPFQPARVETDNDWGTPTSKTGQGALWITGSAFRPGGRFDISFETTLRDFYYILLRGDSPMNILQAVDATLGDRDPRLLSDPTPVSSHMSAFYRLRAVPRVQPLDSDDDGLDDVFELRHPDFLHPFNPSDAARDFDGDGRSNLQEYLDCTDPEIPDSAP